MSYKSSYLQNPWFTGKAPARSDLGVLDWDGRRITSMPRGAAAERHARVMQYAFCYLGSYDAALEVEAHHPFLFFSCYLADC